MTFSDIRWLWALLALPALILLEWRAVRRAERALGTLVGGRRDSVLLAQRRPGNRRFSLLMRLAALALLILGASGPEWGRELARRTASGSDLVLVLDVSGSMEVRDVPPTRLDEARREALGVLDHLEGSRVGVVAFAGDAVRLCPLTQDVATARLVLEGLSTGSVSDPGTDLGRGLRLAAKLMPPGRREEQAIVLWTDGEDLEQGARGAIDELANTGIRVFAVGVGTPAGDVVPVTDEQGRTVDIKRDENGAAVRSRLDEGLLRTLARRTRGGYFAASRPGGELPRLVGALGSLARGARGQRLVERPVARFPLCAAGAALMLALLGLRARRRVERAQSREGTRGGRSHAGRARPPRKPSRPARPAAAVAALLLTFVAGRAQAQSAWARGDAAFRRGQFAQAESLYSRRFGRGGPAAVAVNRATARALRGERDAAEQELSRYFDARGATGDNARFNLGTVLGEEKKYDQALAMLRRALERSPADEDARWNYEWIKRQKEQEQKPEQRQQQQQPKPSPPQPSGGQPQPQNPQPQNSQNAPPNPGGNSQKPQNGGGTQQMTREQADQLLGALQELARADQQRQRKVRVLRDRRGKDW